MKHLSFFFIILSFNPNILNAQNEIDALRYSQQEIYGTARFSSMNGAFGSLGGDFSSLSYNPAGIALYQNSEFTITPNISLINTQSFLKNNSFNNYNLISNAGFGVILRGQNQNSDWERINLGFGWNQIADYNENLYTMQENNVSSLADLLLDQADGNTINNLNSFGAGPAFWTDLIDLENNFVDDSTGWYAFDNGNYISHINSNANKTQSQHINSSGKMGEFVISIGSVFEERIYWGATIGIPSIEYMQNSTYIENSFEDTTQLINSFTYQEDLLAHGNGVNFKVGAIIRIGNNTKIGGALHSPSYISMEEEYTTSISTEWTNQEGYRENSPLGYFNYEIITPWKIIGSISTVLNKKFLISANIEQTDYSSTRMYSDYYQFTDENNEINDIYTTATNLRIGGEVKLHPFSIRAGYGVFGSPYKANPEYETENYSLGLGINMGKTFIDLSYSISTRTYDYTMYSPGDEKATLVENKKENLMMTLGFRF